MRRLLAAFLIAACPAGAQMNIGVAAASNWLSGGKPRINSIVRSMLTVPYCVLSRWPRRT